MFISKFTNNEIKKRVDSSLFHFDLKGNNILYDENLNNVAELYAEDDDGNDCWSIKLDFRNTACDVEICLFNKYKIPKKIKIPQKVIYITDSPLNDSVIVHKNAQQIDNDRYIVEKHNYDWKEPKSHLDNGLDYYFYFNEWDGFIIKNSPVDNKFIPLDGYDYWNIDFFVEDNGRKIQIDSVIKEQILNIWFKGIDGKKYCCSKANFGNAIDINKNCCSVGKAINRFWEYSPIY